VEEEEKEEETGGSEACVVFQTFLWCRSATMSVSRGTREGASVLLLRAKLQKR